MTRRNRPAHRRRRRPRAVAALRRARLPMRLVGQLRREAVLGARALQGRAETLAVHHAAAARGRDRAGAASGRAASGRPSGHDTRRGARGAFRRGARRAPVQARGLARLGRSASSRPRPRVARCPNTSARPGDRRCTGMSCWTRAAHGAPLSRCAHHRRPARPRGRPAYQGDRCDDPANEWISVEHARLPDADVRRAGMDGRRRALGVHARRRHQRRGPMLVGTPDRLEPRRPSGRRATTTTRSSALDGDARGSEDVTTDDQALEQRARELYPGSEYLQQQWLRSVRLVRTTAHWLVSGFAAAAARCASRRGAARRGELMSWTTRSAAWLQQQVKAHPEMTRDELRRWCSKNYPYAWRCGWAYKAWLKAHARTSIRRRCGQCGPARPSRPPRNWSGAGQLRLLP